MIETKRTIGIIGWRGLVGQTLCQRMDDNHDFAAHHIILFSSQGGLTAPSFTNHTGDLSLAHLEDLATLSQCDILIVCQGSAYTQNMHPRLRNAGWAGYWLDASSYLRDKQSAQMVLDPINGPTITNAIQSGQLDFVGANCCTSLLLLALKGLYDTDDIEHVSSTTYQALSGAGASTLKQYLTEVYQANAPDSQEPLLHQCQQLESHAGCTPLLSQVYPTIDALQPSGWTKEELKFAKEASALRSIETDIDATCLRVNMLRCHLQSLVVTLKKPMSLAEIKTKLMQAHPWIKYIEAHKLGSEAFLAKRFSNTLDIGIARLRVNPKRPNQIHLLTIGDQLLWGAAEPLRRTLSEILDVLKNKVLV